MAGNLTITQTGSSGSTMHDVANADIEHNCIHTVFIKFLDQVMSNQYSDTRQWLCEQHGAVKLVIEAIDFSHKWMTDEVHKDLVSADLQTSIIQDFKMLIEELANYNVCTVHLFRDPESEYMLFPQAGVGMPYTEDDISKAVKRQKLAKVDLNSVCYQASQSTLDSCSITAMKQIRSLVRLSMRMHRETQQCAGDATRLVKNKHRQNTENRNMLFDCQVAQSKLFAYIQNVQISFELLPRNSEVITSIWSSTVICNLKSTAETVDVSECDMAMMKVRPRHSDVNPDTVHNSSTTIELSSTHDIDGKRPQEGDKVVATARNSSKLSFEGTNEDNFLALDLDVTDEKSIATAFEKALGKFGRVDVVVNNAGYGLSGEFESLSDKQIRTQMEVNFFGLINVTREALVVMREKNSPPGGKIQQITSIGGQKGVPTFSIYCASKWAVEGFTEALSQEIKPEWNIHLTCIEPGGFRTDWAGRSMDFGAKKTAYDHIDAKKTMGDRNGTQAGDPKKGARAMYEIAKMDDPPLRTVIGSDAYTGIMGQDQEIWRALSKV
ncbi:hypothetical protein MRB53_038984 [Persea americana]|nr:hypothetical protein MRB53_038984 [Persea americana]